MGVRVRDNDVAAQLGAAWGGRVAQLRLRLRLSQADLAALCGVTQQTISKVERGLMVPLDPLKLRLAAALDAHPATLFGWPPELTPADWPKPTGNG